MGLLHILPRLGKSGGHIPHSSPFSYSLRLSLFFPLFLHLRVEAAVFCWRRGGGDEGGRRMGDPRRGTFFFFFFFGEADRVGDRGRTDASWSCGERQWLTMLSGIQDVYSQMCALPRDMDLGNYPPGFKKKHVCPVFSVQVLMRKKAHERSGFENLSVHHAESWFRLRCV